MFTDDDWTIIDGTWSKCTVVDITGDTCRMENSSLTDITDDNICYHLGVCVSLMTVYYRLGVVQNIK